MPPIRRLPLTATLCALACGAGAADAGAPAPSPAPALPTPDGVAPAPRPAAAPPADAAVEGGELALFQEMPVVVSASRRESRITSASAPVSVVTGDDIRYSGERTIGDLLWFTPGVDVLRVDRNRYAVGVRGLHDSFSDRTLSLIDGRSAESPIYGGSEYMRQPLFIDDIERIEVVRGPGGAVWGANAFNGVVNIISKDPERTPGVRAMVQHDSLEDTYTQLRWGEVHGDFAFRLSLGYDDQSPSERWVDHPAAFGTFNGQDYGYGNDWSRNQRYDGQGSWQAAPSTRVRFGLGYDRLDHGAYEFILYQPRETSTDQTARGFVRAEHELPGGSTVSLQYAGTVAHSDAPSIAIFDSVEHAVDAQIDLPEIDRHAVTVGSTVKRVEIDPRTDRPEQATFEKDVYREYWAGLFVVDRWHLVEPLTIEGQARGDYYSGTDPDWSGRLALLYALDPAQDHVLRLAVARAFRTPLIGLRDANVTRDTSAGPFTFPVYSVRAGDNDVSNEHTWSLEAGVASKPIDPLLVRVDGFYQRYTDLISFPSEDVPTGLPSPPFPATFPQYHAENIGSATAHGVEAEATWTVRRLRLDGWYAYDHMHIDDARSVRAYLPPLHSAGAGVRWFLAPDVVANLQYRWSSETPDDPGRNLDDIPEMHRVDAAFSWPYTRHGGFTVGVSDLFDQTGEPVRNLASFGRHETPGRSFFVRGEVTF